MENSITVAEASAIISKAFGYTTDYDTGIYTEADKFKAHVNALAERNALPISMDSLDTPLTRGEMAEIIYRLKTSMTSQKT